jgi:tRNA1(Val) A37 N6-methylase TrmN6
MRARLRALLIIDEEGLELPDLDAARDEATKSARVLLGEAIKTGKLNVPDALVIADQGGQTFKPSCWQQFCSLRGKAA